MAPAWSSRASCDPTPCRAHRPPWPTSWDCATWPSRSTTCRRLSIGQLPRAMDWSVASASTRAPKPSSAATDPKPTAKPLPTNRTRVSTTDPEAELARSKNGLIDLNYKDHRLVDDAHGVIDRKSVVSEKSV